VCNIHLQVVEPAIDFLEHNLVELCIIEIIQLIQTVVQGVVVICVVASPFHPVDHDSPLPDEGTLSNLGCNGFLFMEGLCDSSPLRRFQFVLERLASSEPINLLFIDGTDVRRLPLIERREKLRQLVPVDARSPIQFSDHFDGEGAACSNGPVPWGWRALGQSGRSAPTKAGHQSLAQGPGAVFGGRRYAAACNCNTVCLTLVRRKSRFGLAVANSEVRKRDWFGFTEGLPDYQSARIFAEAKSRAGGMDDEGDSPSCVERLLRRGNSGLMHDRRTASIYPR
jgi:hypothetical protein